MTERPPVTKNELFALLVGAVVLCVVGGYFLYATVNKGADTREPSRAELTDFASELSLGDTRDEVRAAFAAATYAHLEVREWDGDLVMVHTPYEWGATNWHMYIHFQGEKIVGRFVRTEDSTTYKPENSPDDLIAPGFSMPRAYIPHVRER